MPTVRLMLGILLATVPAVARDAPKKRLDAVGDPLPTQALHRFGTSRFCTQAEVVSLVVSKDGKLVAAADREGRAYLWEADTGKERLGADLGGTRVAISPDNQWLAVCGEDVVLAVRNLRDHKRSSFGNLYSPREVAFTPDSKGIATVSSSGQVRLLDLASGKELRSFAGLDENFTASSIAMCPNGKYLAVAAVPNVSPYKEKANDKPFGRVVLWDAGKKDKLKQIDVPGRDIRNLVFLPDQKTLVGQVGARLIAWSIPSLDRIDKIKHDVGSSFAIDAEAKILAVTDGPKAIEFTTGKELHEFESPALLRQVALSGNGKLLAASVANFQNASPRIMLWDLTTGKERVVAEAHRHHVEAVAFSHDGKAIATASHVEGATRVWDAHTAKLLHTFNLDKLAAQKSGGPSARRTVRDSLAFSADRAEVFVSGQRWDLTKGEPIPLKADDDFAFEQTNSLRALITADGRLAASFLHDRSLLFWDPARAKPIKRIDTDDKKARGEWHALAFAPNGKFAATGLWFPPLRQDDGEPLDQTINVWDIAAGKRVRSLRQSRFPVVRLMFAPDGETLAVIGFPYRLELWHLPTGRLLREMYLTEADAQTRFVLPPVAFAPHGQWIAFSHQDGEIALIETMTGKEIQTLRGHLGPISSVAFAPDSRQLLSGGRDTTAILWSALPDNIALPANWKDADKLWLDLGGPTDKAYRVVWSLIGHPDRALEVLTRRLQPDSGATEKEIRELIANLSSAKKFPQRDAAIRRLKEIGVRTLPALEQSLKNAPDLETGRRIQELLKTVETALTPETLRDYRGLMILEMIGTPEARKLLTEIGRGDGAAGKTRMAQAVLHRQR